MTECHVTHCLSVCVYLWRLCRVCLLVTVLLCVYVCVSSSSGGGVSKEEKKRLKLEQKKKEKIQCTTISHCHSLTSAHATPSFIHFMSAFVAVIFSQLMASSSASRRLIKPPSSFVSGHESTMCSMVCCSPQSLSGDEARPPLCMLARHGPLLGLCGNGSTVSRSGAAGQSQAVG